MSQTKTPRDTRRLRPVPAGRREEHATDMDAIDAIDAVHGTGSEAAEASATDGKAGGEAVEMVDDRRAARGGPGLTSTAPTEQDADAAASESSSAPDGTEARSASDMEGDVERGSDDRRDVEDTVNLRRDRF